MKEIFFKIIINMFKLNVKKINKHLKIYKKIIGTKLNNFLIFTWKRIILRLSFTK